MRFRYSLFVLIFSLVLLSITQECFAVSKVARSINFVDFFVGGSMPVGQRDGLPDQDFLINARLVDVNSDDIYSNTFNLGITYGQLRGSHFLWSVGFRFTDHKILDTIPLSSDSGLTSDFNPKYRQFDIDFNFNYYLTDISKTSFSPYGGLGVHGGILTISDDINRNDYSANLGLSLNFGADIKIWNAADAGSFVTLSSINSYDLYGSSDRPKYLNIGGAVKYYFRP